MKIAMLDPICLLKITAALSTPSSDGHISFQGFDVYLWRANVPAKRPTEKHKV